MERRRKKFSGTSDDKKRPVASPVPILNWHLPVHGGKCRDVLRWQPTHSHRAGGNYARYSPLPDACRRESIPIPEKENNHHSVFSPGDCSTYKGLSVPGYIPVFEDNRQGKHLHAKKYLCIRSHTELLR